MGNWWSPTTSKLALLLYTCICSSCATRDPYQDLVRGTISYPFAQKTNPIGVNGTDEKFVIRTLAGETEYVVEIPHAAQFYDVEVPIASMKGDGTDGLKPVKNPQITDRELVANLPKLNLATREERALLDQAFGVGEAGGPTQAPSYVMGIAKVNTLYRDNKYEYALIELNNLLSFFPTSPQLYKMKGTVLIKVNNLKLAEKAWMRAQELAPHDPVLRKGLDRLRKRIAINERMSNPAIESSPDTLPAH